MKKILIILLMILGILSNSSAQEKKSVKPAQKLMPVVSDCKKAIKIPFVKKGIYGPTLAPNGAGEIQEKKSGKKNDLYSFEKEHNSAWYYFDVAFNGDMVLEISPSKPEDDYDFMLFRWTDSTFFDQLSKHKIKPVRTNISRSGKGEGKSITGLSNTGKSEFMHAGPEKTFSKSLPVKKGERYYLALDNVYPNGGGHTVKLGYEKEVRINGTVLDENQKPLKAEISIEDSKGNEFAKTESDSAGNYKLNAWLWTSEYYTIITFNDSSFIDAKTIFPEGLAKNKYRLNDIKTILPKLKGGKKYILGSINFYGDSPKLKPLSMPSLLALYKLMKKNKKMIIRIEGHTNGTSHGLDFAQTLSENRAKTISDSLVVKGIEKERISTIGYSGQYMLYPNPKNDNESELNRRVEINVVSVK